MITARASAAEPLYGLSPLKKNNADGRPANPGAELRRSEEPVMPHPGPTLKQLKDRLERLLVFPDKRHPRSELEILHADRLTK